MTPSLMQPRPAGPGGRWRAVLGAVLAAALAAVLLPAAPGAAQERIERQVRVGTMNRDYIAHIPAGARDSGQRMPVVVALHPGVATGSGMERITQMHRARGAENFVIVYPDGFRRTWNVGYCCGRAERRRVDDVAFMQAILRDLDGIVPVQPRAFFTGFSNGAMLTYYLLCHHTDLVAAAAPYGATYQVAQRGCNPSRPVPILHLHGALDSSAPFEGGRSEGPFDGAGIQTPVREVWQFFLERNGCSGTRSATFLRGTECEGGTGCQAEAAYCRIPDLGHMWPGAPGGMGERLFGPANPAIPGSAAVLEFFGRYR